MHCCGCWALAHAWQAWSLAGPGDAAALPGGDAAGDAGTFPAGDAAGDADLKGDAVLKGDAASDGAALLEGDAARDGNGLGAGDAQSGPGSWTFQTHSESRMERRLQLGMYSPLKYHPVRDRHSAFTDTFTPDGLRVNTVVRA